MASPEKVKHLGVVSEATEELVRVKIDSQAACGSCKARSACSLGEGGEKIIDVHNPEKVFSKGEEVEVMLNEKLGFRALFFGYLLPFMIVVTTLVILTTVTGDEAVGGLGSLLFLVPYYATLYFFRDSLKKTFFFTINKPVNN